MDGEKFVTKSVYTR